MTTIGTAAASQGGFVPLLSAHKLKSIPLLLAALSLGLGGCETTSSLFGQDQSTASTSVAQATQPVAVSKAKIAIAPIIGAPEAVAKQFAAQLGDALRKQNIAVTAQPTDPADYVLRGYVVAAKDKASTKVSYIWDITDSKISDPTRNRVNRITGEETVPLAGPDPWASVSPQLVQTIAERSAASLSAWLPSNAGASAQPVASASAGASGAGAAAGIASAAQPVAALAPPRPTAVAATATGSLGQGDVQALVPSVTGAPGDGSTSLTRALQNELSRNGIATTDKVALNTYMVEGKVTMGGPANGKQAIQIEWVVKDPQGKRLGVVSQKNDIDQGSLDGSWGQTADAAAQAAAQGILKLLPRKTASN